MAYKILLSVTEEADLIARKKNQRDGKVLRRLMSIDMKNKGMRHLEIAEYCDVCIDTLTDWFCLFNEGGFEALCSFNYAGRRVSKLEKYKAEIKEKEKNEGISSLKELKHWIEEKYKVQTCISNLFYFCKKNSIYLTRKQD